MDGVYNTCNCVSFSCSSFFSSSSVLSLNSSSRTNQQNTTNAMHFARRTSKEKHCSRELLRLQYRACTYFYFYRRKVLSLQNSPTQPESFNRKQFRGRYSTIVFIKGPTPYLLSPTGDWAEEIRMVLPSALQLLISTHQKLHTQ